LLKFAKKITKERRMHKRRQVPRITPENKIYLNRGVLGWQFKKAGALFFKDFATIKRIIRHSITKKRPKMKQRDKKKKMKFLKNKKKKKKKTFQHRYDRWTI